MSEGLKYGDLNPGDPFDAEFVFSRAMEELLWVKKTDERVRIVASSSFGLWCYWWRMALCGCRDVETTPELSCFIREGIERRGADPFAGMEDQGIVMRRWIAAWSGMLDEKSETPLPGGRSALRGMKFCLVVLVLRYGLTSGRLKKVGKRTLPDGRVVDRWTDIGLSLQDAREAAALLFAVSVLARVGRIKSMEHIAAADVEERAAMKRSWNGQRLAEMLRAGDLKDFKKTGAGLAGFKKRLRVTAPDVWGKVHRLALEYENQAGNLWMKRERLERWFPLVDG